MDFYLINAEASTGVEAVQEGFHVPGDFTRKSGAWIHAAGSFRLVKGNCRLNELSEYVLLMVTEGSCTICWNGAECKLTESTGCFIPAGAGDCHLTTREKARCIWVSFAGENSKLVVRNMGALLHSPILTKFLPGQMLLGEKIVKNALAYNNTDQATFEMQSLMYALIASNCGQPACLDTLLSDGIADVAASMRMEDYSKEYTLEELSRISQMPQEAFRKRFTNEVGMPPITFVLYQKMEQAKRLLREERYSVREVGCMVGMSDPYHFSRQFKHVTGMSPREFLKEAVAPGATVRGSIYPKKKYAPRGRRKVIETETESAEE